MAIISTIDSIRDWLNKNVCPLVQFKKPDDETMSEEYPYELVHPNAFSMYIPDTSDLPPDIPSNAPCVCVMLTKGKDEFDPKFGSGPGRTCNITLLFRTWSPGFYHSDQVVRTGMSQFQRHLDGEGDQILDTASEGWRDAWHFVDMTLNALECERGFEDTGLILETNKGITFEPIKQDVNLPDAYPYWYAFVDFTVFEPLDTTDLYKLDDGQRGYEFL